VNFLSDECVWQATIDFLRSQGHNVMTTNDAGLRETDDELLLSYAVSKKRIFLTRDMHFSNILVYPPSMHFGLIVLKIKPHTTDVVHRVLKIVLSKFDQQKIQHTLIIVDQKKFRVRY
jgi:predicted nuclease of predicted toxin-antitoxin system